MFMLLTHDNQSTLSSFRLFLTFATNSPVAEKDLSSNYETTVCLWRTTSRGCYL